MKTIDECPVCGNDLSYTEDIEELKWIAKILLSVMNIFGIIRGLHGVAKTMYYDFFTKYKQIEDYQQCIKCKNYIFTCPYCEKKFTVGVKHPITAKKHICPSCKKAFVYATHPDPDTNLNDYL